MRKSLIRLQGNLNGQLTLEVGRADAAARQVRTNTKDVLLANAEVHVDRIELNDGGKQGRRGPGADQFVKRHLAGRYDTIKRRHHMCVAEIDRRLFDIGSRPIDIGLGQIARGPRAVERRLGRNLTRGQVLLALEFCLRLRQRRLRARLGGSAPSSYLISCR